MGEVMCLHVCVCMCTHGLDPDGVELDTVMHVHMYMYVHRALIGAEQSSMWWCVSLHTLVFASPPTRYSGAG